MCLARSVYPLLVQTIWTGINWPVDAKANYGVKIEQAARAAEDGAGMKDSDGEDQERDLHSQAVRVAEDGPPDS